MNAAICAIIKDEHRYLKEWIDYNLGIGFSHIYLFEDYGSKSHKEIVREYADVTLQTLADIGIEPEEFNDGKKCKRQETLYNWAIRYYKGKHDWLALIDIDEFIDFDEGYDLERLCDEFKDKTGLYLYWKIMTSNGQVEYEDKPVRQRFTKIGECLPDDSAWCNKSFVNLNVNTKGMRTIHECYDLYNTYGMQTGIVRCYHKAHIKHYFTKSWEEWCWRFKRGDLVWGHRKVDEFFSINKDMEPRKEELKRWISTKRYNENISCITEGTYSVCGNFCKGKKKLLFVGNKSLADTINVDGYDLVVRYNKMDNYDMTTGKTDVYMMYGVADDFVKKVSAKRLAQIHAMPLIYVNRQWYEWFSKNDKENTSILLPDSVMKNVVFWSDKEVIDGLGLDYSCEDMENFQSAVRTILFLLWKYGKEYFITIAAIDRNRQWVGDNAFHVKWEEEERMLDYLLRNEIISEYDSNTDSCKK